ncbi:hypothetical protein BKA65DRAFT_16501 [Rhexocercosporidium sp. MPI-PUGE-AT-0058]|nr:hypothetical protein BKA65DRAFT_16501 [Rhexocercosporidium sp. MPI-PUGE-AT-0058]
MMDHDVDVALWRRGILLEEGHQEAGPACYLFEASILTFSALLQVLAADSVHYDSESYGRLREEFRKFYMWNEGFSTRTGDLDHVLACSKNLKGTVLGLMVQWVRTVSQVPEIMSEFDWSSVFTKFTELQMITSKVEQVAKASISDMKSQYSVFDNLNLEDGSESESDSDLESSMSEYVFEDIIEDLRIASHLWTLVSSKD